MRQEATASTEKSWPLSFRREVCRVTTSDGIELTTDTPEEMQRFLARLGADLLDARGASGLFVGRKLLRGASSLKGAGGLCFTDCLRLAELVGRMYLERGPLPGPLPTVRVYDEDFIDDDATGRAA